MKPYLRLMCVCTALCGAVVFAANTGDAGANKPAAEDAADKDKAKDKADKDKKPADKNNKPVIPELPPMTLSKQFAGPLEQTAIQRFIDPETGVVCYLYSPHTVLHQRNDAGQVAYGANDIGSISCVAPWRGDAPQ